MGRQEQHGRLYQIYSMGNKEAAVCMYGGQPAIPVQSLSAGCVKTQPHKMKKSLGFFETRNQLLLHYYCYHDDPLCYCYDKILLCSLRSALGTEALFYVKTFYFQ